MSPKREHGVHSEHSLWQDANGGNTGQVSPLLVVALTFVATRAVMALIGVLSALNNGDTFTVTVGHWDVEHFITIAQRGYTSAESVAFFPGLPMLLWLANLLGIPMILFGCLVSLAASWVAALALLRLYGPIAACFWLIAPTAVFTMIPYTEALFCATAFWAWERAKTNNWNQAAILAAVSCLFRISGLFLWGALGLLAISQIRRNGDWPRHLGVKVAWLMLPLAVVGAYELYLHSLTGSWTAWLDAQRAGWARGFTNPWDSLQHTLDACSLERWVGRPDVAWVFRAEVVSMAVGLITAVVLAWKRRLGELGWIAVHVVAFGTSFWYMSANRAVLLWFPLFGLLAEWAVWAPKGATARRMWRGAIVLGVLASVTAMGIWAWLFFNGKWSS